MRRGSSLVGLLLPGWCPVEQPSVSAHSVPGVFCVSVFQVRSQWFSGDSYRCLYIVFAAFNRYDGTHQLPNPRRPIRSDETATELQEQINNDAYPDWIEAPHDWARREARNDFPTSDDADDTSPISTAAPGHRIGMSRGGRTNQQKRKKKQREYRGKPSEYVESELDWREQRDTLGEAVVDLEITNLPDEAADAVSKWRDEHENAPDANGREHFKKYQLRIQIDMDTREVTGVWITANYHH